MGFLTIILIITVAWFVYHFVIAYRSKQTNPEKLLRKLAYGKTWGLFAMITGLLGQLIGLIGVFDAVEIIVAAGEEIKPLLVFGGIKVTMIVAIYGILIYLFSILLWFVSSFIIEKRINN